MVKHPVAKAHASIAILDRGGQTEIVKPVALFTLNTLGFDISKLPAGYYTVIFTNGTEKHTKIFVKQ